MLPQRPAIAVIGTGAIGGYYGARLAQHGHDVHFLFRGDFEHVRRGGLVVRSCRGDFVLPPERLRAYRDPAAMPPADLVIVALKATANHLYEPLIRPVLKEGTAILTLQNGLGNEERLSEIFGAGRIMGGLCFVCINRVAPGIIHHMDYGLVCIGEFAGGASARLRQVADMFAASNIECRTLDDLRRGRWEKLTWNVPFSGLSAVLDVTTDRIIGSPEGERLAREIIGEVIAAARGAGVELPDSIVDERIEQTRRMVPYKTSMQIDREVGRPMEVEAILGEPLRAAQRAGVSTPRMAMLYQMARLLDSAPPDNRVSRPPDPQRPVAIAP